MTPPESSPVEQVALKPCPWCAGTDLRRPMQDVWEKWLVGCVLCGAEGPQANSPAMAIAAWNTRARTEADQGVREALEPFGNAADRIDYYDGEAYDAPLYALRPNGALRELLNGRDGEAITVGDLRRARAALTGSNPGADGGEG